MDTVLIPLCVTLLWLIDPAVSSVVQNPRDIIAIAKDSAKIKCAHTIKSYDRILWYQHSQDTGFKLMGYLFADSHKKEAEFEDKIELSGNGKNNGFLTINNLAETDGAMYFCAAYSRTGSQAHFGNGTKLTVLDPDVKISYPEVQILNPRAREECQKTTVTVVCIAANFYPDHVTVAWYNDGNEITSGVATDNAATKNNSNPYYSISSRLSVLYEDWSKGSTYTCTVTFFDGKDHSKHSDSTSGLSGISYKYTARATKVAYLMFICKSLVYGLFIVFFIKRQTSK